MPTDVIAGDTAAATCVDLTGAYQVNNAELYANVVSRWLTPEQRAVWWTRVVIQPRSTDSIAVRLERDDTTETTRTVPLRGVFACATGWLTTAWPYELLASTTRDPDDGRAYEHRLWITRDVDGRLVGREVIVSYRRIAVWCGDGCQYIRIPFTGRETMRWHRMSTVSTAARDEAMPPPNEDPESARARRAEAAREERLPPAR